MHLKCMVINLTILFGLIVIVYLKNKYLLNFINTIEKAKTERGTQREAKNKNQKAEGCERQRRKKIPEFTQDNVQYSEGKGNAKRKHAG